MNHFNLLPPEIIEFIFKKVYFDDLINLRIVDKRFKQICDQIKIKQLWASDEFDYYQSIWFYTNDRTYYNNKNSIKFSKFQNYATIFQFNKHLKRLALNIQDFNFSILNQFKLLEQLYVTTYELIDNYTLRLDHLKIFDFDLEDNSDFKLTLDTIKLFAFRFRNQFNRDVVFNYPDKIRFLELVQEFDLPSLYDNYHDYDYLKNFNNLQYLEIDFLNASSMDGIILSQLKNLKILDLSFENLFSDYDNIIKNVKFLINEKEKSRSKLEIYFYEVKLINQNKLNELKLASNLAESRYNLFEFQIKNYDLLKDNCYRSKINYCDLIKLIKIIPSSFTNKFPFIYQVEANDRIDNEDQFIKFLNNLTYLSELELINCELTKSFYDQLINLVCLNNLEYLTIEEKKDLEINFDFILHLKQLNYFQTNQIIANHIDLIYKLFKINDFMYLFIFKCDSKNFIKIYKNRSYNLDDKYSWYEIEYYYLDDDLEKVKNFTIGDLEDLEDLEDLDDVISKLKEIKF